MQLTDFPLFCWSLWWGKKLRAAAVPEIPLQVSPQIHPFLHDDGLSGASVWAGGFKATITYFSACHTGTQVAAQEMLGGDDPLFSYRNTKAVTNMCWWKWPLTSALLVPKPPALCSSKAELKLQQKSLRRVSED